MKSRFAVLLMGSMLAGSAGIVPPVLAAAPASDLAACYASQTQTTPFAGVLLVKDKSGVFFQSVGTTDGSKSIARDTRFRLASVGKTLTRIAIGQLVAQGKINLDAPIVTYLPELPAAFARITVEQLAQHRSGVTPMTMFTPDSFATMRDAKTAHDLLPLVTHEPLAFPPGTQEQYSNGGYFLLGAIIEAVTGKSYSDYMRDALFKPLGMNATSLDADGKTAEPMSRMTGPGSPPLAEPGPVMMMRTEHGTPAGDAVTTGDDMLKLGDALMDDRLLPPEVKHRLFPKRGDVWQIGQAGGALGENTFFAAMPDVGATVVTLSNYDPPAADLLGSVMADAVAGKGCKPMTPADRPSLLIAGPPPSPKP